MRTLPLSAPRAFFLALFAVLLSASWSLPNPLFAQTQHLLEKAYADYQQETAEFVEKLEGLQHQAARLGDRELEQKISDRLEILASDSEAMKPLPRKLQPAIPYDMPAELRSAHVQFRQACQDYAGQLYLLARRSQRLAPTFAFELINLLLQFDPDHGQARPMRGYVRQGDEWMTAFERDKLRSREIDHPRFGWIREDDQARYEAGERPYHNTWISAEKEQLLRQNFTQGWDIETEHFQIRTNVGLEEGVELGRKLETFYDYFISTFAPFYNSPEQIRQLFDSTTGRTKSRSQRYEVHFLRSKQEYVDRLIRRIPQIAMTNGLYQLEDRVSYFYHDPEANNDATIFHEATHQLMYESHLAQREVGRGGHFWIVEGIACYMESFQVTETPDGFDYSVGDPRFIRFYWARHRLLEEDYYVPLQVFSQLGMIPYQQGDQKTLQQRYSQASGLAHFFMHYQNGVYRTALMQHLAQIYHSNPSIQRNVHGLDKLTGVSYGTLDRQYREYIQDQQTMVGDQVPIQ
ncbi:DUF1570 domain-containing protein [Rubinisphaera margarita]|uniref:DUF1570 domain-containing protein n=1 Tax=Rubinisphaera margarita TaxID=2909586 RepID=UPI001EE9AC94|nr:DUF1570 domain-containing protein [Rubinisphaera margarita]MCG6157401.1 DUF1570 domain-containing protein [Rubinisphaera margarita]